MDIPSNHLRLNRSGLAPVLALTLARAIASALTTSPQEALTNNQVAAGDQGWPRLFTLPAGDSALIYQPQIANWDNQKHIVALSAVSYLAKDATQPTLGTLKIEADTSIALEARLVELSDVRWRWKAAPLTNVRF